MVRRRRVPAPKNFRKPAHLTPAPEAATAKKAANQEGLIDLYLQPTLYPADRALSIRFALRDGPFGCNLSHLFAICYMKLADVFLPAGHAPEG